MNYICVPIQKCHVFAELERSAVFMLRNAQLEQIKVNALCMVNSKTLQHGFLGPELKLHEELTCIGGFNDNALHMNAYNLNYCPPWGTLIPLSGQ